MTAGRSDAADENEPLRLYDALEEVLAGLAAATNVADACAVLAGFGVRHLRADGAAVSRQGRRGLEFLAATDPGLTDLGSARAATPDGSPAPSLGPGETLMIPEIGAGTSASTWHTLAAAQGFSAAVLIGLPSLSAGETTLELFSRRPAAFSARPLRGVAQVVRLAGLALREAERRLNLEEALHTRGVIGQAQGVLMERYTLSGTQAMAFLRRQSQHTQQPIREIAAGLVRRREADTEGAPPNGPEDTDGFPSKYDIS